MKHQHRIYYRKNLPHIQPIGATFFVTCSLKGALPKKRLLQLKEKYELKKLEILKEKSDQKTLLLDFYMENLELILNENKDGPNFLADSKIANILVARIKKYDGVLYSLIAYTLMSNHFHILIDTSVQLARSSSSIEIPQNYQNLDKIMNLIKGGSARYINLYRGKTGTQVWQNESFDTYMRNEHMTNRKISYILNNPVKAGIVNNHEDHPHTWSKELDDIEKIHAIL